MKKVFCCICALATFLSLAGEYQVDLPEGGIGAQVAALEISGEQLRNLGGHPAWLRLYDAKGSIVPWAREQATAKSLNHTWQNVSPKIDLVRKLDDGALEVSFHTAPEVPLSDEVKLEFKTDVRNFGMFVKVYGKEAGGEEHERKVQGTGYIFDSTENMDARELTVVFNPGKCQAFRVLISSANLERIKPERSVSVTRGKTSGEVTNEKMTVVEQPFSIKSLELWSKGAGEEVSRPKTQKLSVPFEVVKVADGKSIYTITPGVIPVSNMELEFAEENYSRKIIVKSQGKGGEHIWGTGGVSRLSIGEVGHAKTEMQPYSDYVDGGELQLIIEDNDNPPLTLQKVSLVIPLYRLKFVVKPEQFPLKLTASPNSDEPVYDVASILSLGGDALNVRIIHPGKFTGEAFSTERSDASSGIPRAVLLVAVGFAIAVMTVVIALTLKRNG